MMRPGPTASATLPQWSTCGLAGLVLALGVAPPAALAAPAEVVFERASGSVVVVERLDQNGQRKGYGSGVVTGYGELATSCHLLNGAARLRVRSDHARIEASLAYPDPERDLCLLSAPGLSASPVPIADADLLKVGQRVYAIGTPKGLERTLSEGLVSSLRPRSRSFLIQTTAPMSPGSSGGGLFDEEGRLIGIATHQYTRGQNLNFAVPASWIGEIRSRARTRWLRSTPEGAVAHPAGAQTLALMDVGQHEGALQAAREWVRSAPTDALPRYMLGRAAAGLGRGDEAVDAFRSALRLRPDLLQAWLDLGATLARFGEPQRALDAYLEVRSRDPQAAPAWIGSGRALSALGRHEEAVQALQEAILLDAGDAAAWDALGAAHVAADRLDLAAAVCRKGLKLHPESAQLWYRFGLVHAERADRIQAIQAQQEALRLEPGFLPALYELGELYFDQGDWSKSEEVYKRLRKLDRSLAENLRERQVPDPLLRPLAEGALRKPAAD
jgi:tetratricopeptide (TPR) repeat protein